MTRLTGKKHGRHPFLAAVAWLGRAIAVLALTGLLLVVAMLLVRLLRPTTWRVIAFGELPRIKALKVLGQEFQLAERMYAQHDQQLVGLEQRAKMMVEVLHKYGEHLAAYGQALEALQDTEDRDGQQSQSADQEGSREEGASA